MVLDRRVERFRGVIISKSSEVALVFGTCEFMFRVKP